MKTEQRDTLCGYRFFVADDANTLKPFMNCEDRRIASIQKTCESRIYLTRDICLRKGQRKRAVLVRARTRRTVETCLRRIDDTFPKLYACACLHNAKTTLQMVQLKKYCTNEDISVNFPPSPVVYYQLSFFFDAGDMAAYEYWKQSTDALLVKQCGCTLLVSMRDSPGAGFLRRYAVISGENKKNAIEAYNIFRASFSNLPEWKEKR